MEREPAMPRNAFCLSLLASTALTLASCGEGADEPVEPAGEPVTASPTPAPGVPQDELETRQAISGLGTAARALQDADSLESARDALGRFEADFAEGADELPPDLRAQFEGALEAARDALAADNLPGVQMAGQAMINTVLLSERIQDPTLVRPDEPEL